MPQNYWPATAIRQFRHGHFFFDYRFSPLSLLSPLIFVISADAAFLRHMAAFHYAFMPRHAIIDDFLRQATLADAAIDRWLLRYAAAIRCHCCFATLSSLLMLLIIDFLRHFLPPPLRFVIFAIFSLLAAVDAFHCCRHYFFAMLTQRCHAAAAAIVFFQMLILLMPSFRFRYDAAIIFAAIYAALADVSFSPHAILMLPLPPPLRYFAAMMLLRRLR